MCATITLLLLLVLLLLLEVFCPIVLHIGLQQLLYARNPLPCLQPSKLGTRFTNLRWMEDSVSLELAIWTCQVRSQVTSRGLTSKPLHKCFCQFLQNRTWKFGILLAESPAKLCSKCASSTYGLPYALLFWLSLLFSHWSFVCSCPYHSCWPMRLQPCYKGILP